MGDLGPPWPPGYRKVGTTRYVVPVRSWLLDTAVLVVLALPILVTVNTMVLDVDVPTDYWAGTVWLWISVYLPTRWLREARELQVQDWAEGRGGLWSAT